MKSLRISPAALALLVAAALLAACAPGLPMPATPAAAPVTAPPSPPPSSPAGASPALAANVCPITVTRTPPPGAPTFIPGGPNPKTGPVDPHVELCASALALRPGETLSLTALAVDIGLPYYTLMTSENGTDWQPVATVTYENEMRGPAQSTPRFLFVSAKGAMREATFVLHARLAGEALFRVNATGEVHYGYPGPATQAGGGSDAVRVVVAGP